MTTTHLLYLHGFRSSPSSAKARQMAAHVAQHHPAVTFWCPQLPPSPQGAMALV
ncbi:YqiA/YcfP family alpha/beta fold hydrolase, partial [Acinetobacter baumannii]